MRSKQERRTFLHVQVHVSNRCTKAQCHVTGKSISCASLTVTQQVSGVINIGLKVRREFREQATGYQALGPPFSWLNENGEE